MNKQADLTPIEAYRAFSYEVYQVGFDRRTTRVVACGLREGLSVHSHPGAELQFHLDDVLTFSVSTTVDRLAYYSESAQVCLVEMGCWDAPTVIRELPWSPDWIALSPDSQLLACVSRDCESLAFLDVASGAVECVALRAPPNHVSWVDQGDKVAVTTLDGHVIVFAVEGSGREVGARQLFSVFCGALTCSDGVVMPRHAVAIEFDRVRECFAFVDLRDRVSCVDLAGRLSYELVGGTASMWGLQSLTTSRTNGLCAVAGGNCVSLLGPGGIVGENGIVHRNTVWALGASDDGKLVVSGGDDGVVAVWDAGAVSATTHASSLAQQTSGEASAPPPES